MNLIAALQCNPIAISVRQPHAHRIIYAGKDIENRDWKPWNPGLKFRGPVLIHAAKGVDAADREDMTSEMLLGGVIGCAEIIDVVTDSESRWFFGPYGLVLRNPTPLQFIPCKGALGFFKPDIQPSAIRAIGLAA